MKNSRLFVVFLLVIAFVISLALPAYAQSNNFTNAAIPPEVASENAPTYTLTHKIYIENFANGSVSVIDISGKHTIIGYVYRPATVAKNSSDGFWLLIMIKELMEHIPVSPGLVLMQCI